MDRWIRFVLSGPTPADLVRFHTADKLTLLARSRVLYDRLGRLVAGRDDESFEERLRRYGEIYAVAMAMTPTRGGHVDALHHAAGRLKRAISPADRAELAGLITLFRTGERPLRAPIELLRHHFDAHRDEWAAAQSYLHPAPNEFETHGDD